jgi:hypothetical protein
MVSLGCHFPSLIIKLMKADLYIQTGLELEVGWAPVLLRQSGNNRIQSGAAGFLDAFGAGFSVFTFSGRLSVAVADFARFFLGAFSASATVLRSFVILLVFTLSERVDLG